MEHTSAELFDIAAFGLPEVKGEEIQKAKQRFANKEQTLVACAGCYPTATSLAAYPAIDICEGLVVVDAVSGVTELGAMPRSALIFVPQTKTLRPMA